MFHGRGMQMRVTPACMLRITSASVAAVAEDHYVDITDWIIPPLACHKPTQQQHRFHYHKQALVDCICMHIDTLYDTSCGDD